MFIFKKKLTARLRPSFNNIFLANYVLKEISRKKILVLRNRNFIMKFFSTGWNTLLQISLQREENLGVYPFFGEIDTGTVNTKHFWTNYKSQVITSKGLRKISGKVETREKDQTKFKEILVHCLKLQNYLREFLRYNEKKV